MRTDRERWRQEKNRDNIRIWQSKNNWPPKKYADANLHLLSRISGMQHVTTENFPKQMALSINANVPYTVEKATQDDAGYQMKNDPITQMTSPRRTNPCQYLARRWSSLAAIVSCWSMMMIDDDVWWRLISILCCWCRIVPKNWYGMNACQWRCFIKPKRSP